MKPLKVGDLAPEFTADGYLKPSQSLREYRGKYVLLYFYPMDDTPGCTVEACGFRDNIQALQDKGVVILGVSSDDLESHRAFSQKYALPFELLSDPDKHIRELYGARTLFSKRCSFLIDPEGKIARVYDPVDPQTHATEILNDLAKLK